MRVGWVGARDGGGGGGELLRRGTSRCRRLIVLVADGVVRGMPEDWPMSRRHSLSTVEIRWPTEGNEKRDFYGRTCLHSSRTVI